MALADQVKAAVFRYIMGVEVLTTTAISSYFAGGTTVVGYFDGGYPDIIVRTTPILSISAVYNMSSSATVTATTYNFDPDLGCVFKVNGTEWAGGDLETRRKWKITYIAGYAAMPADIQLAITTWTNHLTADSSGHLKSYKTGDDSETYADIGDIPPQVKALLSKYKRMLF